MKVIGFSSGVVGRDSNVDRMVKAIMDKSGGESEFVKLNDINYAACKSCVWLCAKPQLCKLEDELAPYLQKVVDADAVVLGSPVHAGSINAAMHAFISRLWGFRHVNILIKNKPAVLATCGIGFKAFDTSEKDFRRALMMYQLKILDVISHYSKIPPCYSCGRHQECMIGGARMMWGKECSTLEITPELFTKWEDNSETVEKIEAAGQMLRDAVAVG